MQYTTYYELPQYEANDKTAWLTTFNQAMLAIDTGIHAAKAAADSAGTAASSASSVASQASLDVASLTRSLDTVIGTINTINSLIGNGTPTTTDHTLIGAINELHANQGDLANLATTDKTSLVAAINEVAGGSGGSSSASDVSYDNTDSGLTATNVQAAIDELSENTFVLSSTEKKVGVDVDGSDIYEKTYYSDSVNLTADTVIDATISNSYVGRVIDINAALFTSDNVWSGPEDTESNNTRYVSLVVVGATGLVIKLTNMSVTKYHITVRYTKAA